MLYEIKHRYDGSVLFSLECGSMKLCVEAAVKAKVNLNYSNLRGSDMSGSDLSGSNLSGSNLSYSNLSGSDLSGSNLRGSNLRGSNLSGSNLSYSNLSGSNLSGSNLSYSNLRSSDLRGSDLSGSDLSYSNLGYSNLRSSDLRGSNLSGSNLSGSDMSGSKGINKNSCTPLRILLDQPGKIRAYKLVTTDLRSPMHDRKLTYAIGSTITVDDANTDENAHCASGINLATLDWCMREWKYGYRILMCEFTAKDIAAIPTATGGKFRVRRCKIVGEKDLKEIGLVV